MEEKKKKKKTVGLDDFDLNVFLMKILRSSFRKTPLYNETKKRAKTYVIEYSKHGKPMDRVRFTCAECKRLFLDKAGAKEIAVDHIIPVIDPEKGWEGIEVYIKRLFCSIDNLQVLCNYKGKRDGKLSCHKIKTKEENLKRKQSRKKKKD